MYTIHYKTLANKSLNTSNNLPQLSDAEVQISSSEQEDASSVSHSIAKFTLLSSSTIHRVPTKVKDNKEHYQEYYVPKVVSIGPYHHGNPKLDSVEEVKPLFTMKLLLNEENIFSLFMKLVEPNMVQELRNFYEEKSTDAFCNKEFVKMMLLDACFILYYIQHFFGEKIEDSKYLTCHQIAFVHHDLFLLENQIPFEVLDEVMKMMNISRVKNIKPFINDNILACGRRRKGWYKSIYSTIRNGHSSSTEKSELDFNGAQPDDLLHLYLTKDKVPDDKLVQTKRVKFRHVRDLTNLGIHFKPDSTMSLADIEFSRTWYWWFSASVELAPITVDDFTKPLLLNLIAYEMYSRGARNSWVTSYICLLDSLIDYPEDVKTLIRGTDLVPKNLAYLDAKFKIERHLESWLNRCVAEFQHDYLKSPWTFIALVGTFMALFLSDRCSSLLHCLESQRRM